MKYSLIKKSLAVLLCAVLLCSVWVFTAPEASASVSNYAYTFQLITENNADCNDHGHPVLEIYGKTANGTGGEELIHQVELDYDYIQKKNTYTFSDTLDKFPCRVYLSIDFDAGGFSRKWEGKFKISVNGTYVLNDTSNRSLEGGSLFSHEMKSMSVSVDTANYPKAQQCTFTKKPPESITVPKHGESPKAYDIAAEVTDQFGTVWYEQPNIYLSEYVGGVSISDGKLNVTSAANSADGSDTTVQVIAGHSTLSASSYVTIINAKYSYEFVDEGGTTISSGTLKSGQSIPRPADLTKQSDRNNHYLFDGWSPADTRLTKDTVFTPKFTAEAHKFLTYSSDKNATCTKDGTKTSTCTCGMEKTIADEGSALGHSYTYAITKEATCTEKGIITYTCIRGDDSYTVDINPTGHQYTKQVVAPGCESKGYDLYTCSTCEFSYKDNYTDAIGHAWNSGSITKQATCTEDGEKEYTCTRCPQTYSEPIAKLGHNLKTWTIEQYATCTQNGSRYSTCTRTGCKEVVREELKAFGHSWTEWAQKDAPTCEQAGRMSRSCMICGEPGYDPIPALGHDMVEKTRTPEDGTQGMIYYECSRGCGKYAPCHIEADGTKSIGAVCEYAALEADTVEIPTATFNTYNRVESNYDYSMRGGSLRIDENAPADKQDLRFCASLLIPQNAEVLDFGYIYTRVDYFSTLKKFVLNGNHVASLSVKDGYYSTFQTEQGEVKTFNIVIGVDKDNWAYEYIARPYIIYRFAGETYTVYDSIYASRSVNYIAQQVMASPYETEFVKEYVQNKILGY